MVDWKKDIKLSNLLARGSDHSELATPEEATPFESESPHAEAPVAPVHDEDTKGEAAEETPFWKRDLSLRRTRDDVEPEQAFDQPEEEKKPFFKRELSFRRRSDQPVDEHFSAEDLEHDPVAADVEPDETEKKPFLKREISFRRRSDESSEESFEDESPQESAPEWVGTADVETEETDRKPFFKRELSFRRRRDDSPDDDPAPEEWVGAETAGGEAEETTDKEPFFKRELSFRRRRDDSPDDEPAPEEWAGAEAVDEGPEEPTDKKPFFKRELSFGRSMKEPVEEEFTADPLEGEQTAETEAAAATPFWKRDLNFRSSQDDVPETEPADGQASSEDKTPFFKRELTFRRSKDEPADEPVAAGMPAAEPEDAFPSEDEVPDHDPSVPVAFHEMDPEPQPVEDASSWEQQEEPASAQLPPEPQHGSEPRFADSTSFVAPAPANESPADLPVHEPVAWEAPQAAEQLERDAFVDSAHEDSMTPGLHNEPSEGDSDDRKPFWKRELGFGRPKATTDPSFEAPAETGKPRLKRQLSFRRKTTDVEAPKREKKPLFKRELRLPFRNRESRETQVARVVTKETRIGRKKDLVGLKIGASQIAAARVVNNGSPELVQVARQPIEQGIVVGGELRDPEALADALRDFFAKYKLPGRNVRLGIGNNRIGVRSLEISGVHDPKQLENAIRYRAQEALPIPLDEAVLDYHVVDESTSQTGIRTYRVLLVVAYRELVDRYSAACRSAGLRLVGIDLEAFALLRALSPPPAEGFPADTALVAVSIGHDRSTFAVSNGTVCEFTRVLDWGGSSLNTAMARALDITPSQAEPVKRTLALNPEEHDAGVALDEHTVRAEEAVRLELQSFARELVSSLHFYQNQPGSLAIGSIVLTGGTAHMPGLAAELQRLVGVKVRVGDPLRRVKTGKRVDSPDQLGSLAIAIGLGIED